MYTKEAIIDDLTKLKIDSKGTLLVHLSCKSIGEVKGGADTVIDALMEYMKDGLLIIPTHTWSNVNINDNNTMDVLNTPACIGIVPELFRKRKGVVRSLHPTHSVGAYGKDAESYIEGEEKIQTPCGRDSVYQKLLDRNATILLIGVGFTRLTYIHGIEEWNNIPNRLSVEPHSLYVLDANGKKHFTPQMRHCAALGSETYWKLEPYMIKKQAAFEGKIGNAKALVVSAYKLNYELTKLLKDNPSLLDENTPLPSELL